MKLKKQRCITLGCKLDATYKGSCDNHRLARAGGHKKQEQIIYERWYGLKVWKDIRRRHLSNNPLCIHCTDLGLLTVADSVDHIIAHKGEYALFIDPANLQSLCRSCHTIKTNKEDR